MDLDMPPIDEVPAAHLEGRRLDHGWTVGPKATRSPMATGGYFSVCYAASNDDGRDAFMKALNFYAAVSGGRPIADELRDFTSAYTFERDLLADCCSRRMGRVIQLVDHGEVVVPEAGVLSRVPYLILELADGDIRAFQSRSAELDCAWAFRVMKHSLEGIGQLHAARAAHQDLKPSNVLTQNRGSEMKIGDLGRAERVGVETPWSESDRPGAIAYAPPEQLYGYFSRTWEERRAADLYLVGSLGAQLFLGHCMSTLIQDALVPECRPERWSGSYEELLPYLFSAHADVIAALKENAMSRVRCQETAQQFAAAIAQMTYPDVPNRGHPKDRAARTSSYAVHRYVSLMDVLSTRTRIRALGVPQSG